MRSDLKKANYATHRVKQSGTYEADVLNIIQSFRSKKLSHLQEVFQILYENNDGSVVFDEVYKSLSEAAAIERQYIEERRGKSGSR